MNRPGFVEGTVGTVLGAAVTARFDDPVDMLAMSFPLLSLPGFALSRRSCGPLLAQTSFGWWLGVTASTVNFDR